MQDKTIHASTPSRRSIAKGAAWALPALTVAGVAPSLAASILECSAASQQAINNAITLDKAKTAKLQLNYYQTADTVNGGATTLWVNLKNIGTSAIRGSAADPIVVKVTFRSVNNVDNERIFNRYRTNGWGTVTKSQWSNMETTFTWTLPQDIPRGAEARITMDIGTRGANIYADATMLSFGPNDDLQPSDFPALSEILTGEQASTCQDYYDAQVQANLTADYTLLASGRYTSGDGIPWPVGESVDSRTIGNGSPLNIGYATDGKW